MSNRHLREAQKQQSLTEQNEEVSSESDDVENHMNRSGKNIFSLLTNIDNSDDENEKVEEEKPAPKHKNKAAIRKKPKMKKKSDKIVPGCADKDECPAQQYQGNAVPATNVESASACNVGDIVYHVDVSKLNPDKRRGADAQAPVNPRKDLHKSRLVEPLINWPPIKANGLSMRYLEMQPAGNKPGQYFAYEYKQKYQILERKFIVKRQGVTMLQDVSNHDPYHIKSLLLRARLRYSSDDKEGACDEICKAVYMLEYAAAPRFNFSGGLTGPKLSYQIVENRTFYITMFYHAWFSAHQKHQYESSLQMCKLLLSMSPDYDPVGSVLLLDYLSLQCEQYDYLHAFYYKYRGSDLLSTYPSLLYSVALAMYHNDDPALDKIMCEAVAALPLLAVEILTKLDRITHKPYCTQNDQEAGGVQRVRSSASASDQLVTELYLRRSARFWLPQLVKEPHPAPNQGSLTPHEDSSAPHKGSLAPHEGSSAPQEGSPAPQEGSPLAHEGSDEPHLLQSLLRATQEYLATIGDKQCSTGRRGVHVVKLPLMRHTYLIHQQDLLKTYTKGSHFTDDYISRQHNLYDPFPPVKSTRASNKIYELSPDGSSVQSSILHDTRDDRFYIECEMRHLKYYEQIILVLWELVRTYLPFRVGWRAVAVRELTSERRVSEPHPQHRRYKLHLLSDRDGDDLHGGGGIQLLAPPGDGDQLLVPGEPAAGL